MTRKRKKKKAEITDWGDKINLPNNQGTSEWSNRRKASYLLKKLKEREREMKSKKYKLGDHSNTILLIPQMTTPEEVSNKIDRMLEHLRIKAGTKINYFDDGK